jgi:hypothetical protein
MRSGWGFRPRVERRCTRPLPLFVEKGDKRERVGSIDAGRAFWTRPNLTVDQATQLVQLEGAPFQLFGARTTALVADLARCSVNP